MGFAIKTAEAKKARKDKMNAFVSKYGCGTKKLTINEKNDRINKLLGHEVEKFKGFGKNKDFGVELFTKDKQQERIDPEFKGKYDPITEEVKDNFLLYPDDPYRVSKDGTSKVLDVTIMEDGSFEMEGIHLTGAERDVRRRCSWGVSGCSDKELCMLETKQYEQGILKEVSDRTMKLHEEMGILDILLEDDNINTDEDRINQY